MTQPLSPRAQEVLAAIERDMLARRDPDAEPPAAPPRAAAPETDPARLLALVDDLTAQAGYARRRLGVLTGALREVEERFDGPVGDGAGAEAASTVGGALDTRPDAVNERDQQHVPVRRAGRAPDVAVIDLHHHLLPGIDDGPATLAESLGLARAAVEAGTRTVVVTPHVSWDYTENTAERIAAGLAELREALATEGIPLEVLPGAEVAVTRAVDLADEELAALRLGHGPYLLVECPFTPSAVGFEFLLEALLARGNRILLAHPERCPAFQREPELLTRLVGRGILTQITAGSLSGSFGRTVQDFAQGLISDGLVHVIASDAHSVDRRPPSVWAELEAAGYAEQAGWLAREMPRAILDGGPLPLMPAMPPRPRTGLKRLLGR